MRSKYINNLKIFLFLTLTIFVQYSDASYNFDQEKGTLTLSETINTSELEELRIKTVLFTEQCLKQQHSDCHVKLLINTSTFDKIVLPKIKDERFLQQLWTLMRDWMVLFQNTTITEDFTVFTGRINYLLQQNVLPLFNHLKLKDRYCFSMAEALEQEQSEHISGYKEAYITLRNLTKARSLIIKKLSSDTQTIHTAKKHAAVDYLVNKFQGDIDKIDREIAIQFNRCIGQMLLQRCQFPTITQAVATNAYGYDISNRSFTFFADRTYSIQDFRFLTRLTERYSLETLYLPITTEGKIAIRYQNTPGRCIELDEDRLSSWFSMYKEVVLVLEPYATSSRLGETLTPKGPIITLNFMDTIIRLLKSNINISKVQFNGVILANEDLQILDRWVDSVVQPQHVENLKRFTCFMKIFINDREKLFENKNTTIAVLFAHYIGYIKTHHKTDLLLPLVYQP